MFYQSKLLSKGKLLVMRLRSCRPDHQAGRHRWLDCTEPEGILDLGLGTEWVSAIDSSPPHEPISQHGELSINRLYF